jgi:hypothetical protein
MYQEFRSFGAIFLRRKTRSPEPWPHPHRYECMKAITAAFVAVFILWVVDVNLNGSRYTDAVTRMIRSAVASIGVRN